MPQTQKEPTNHIIQSRRETSTSHNPNDRLGRIEENLLPCPGVLQHNLAELIFRALVGNIKNLMRRLIRKDCRAQGGVNQRLPEDLRLPNDRLQSHSYSAVQRRGTKV